MTAHDLPTCTVQGSPKELGHGQGEAFRERIQQFVPMRFDAVRQYFVDAGRGDFDELLAVGRACFEVFRKWDPDAFEEHCAVAQAAGVLADELFTAGNMTDMRDVLLLRGLPDAEGCSSILIPGSHTKSGLVHVGQTWDLNPQDVDYVVGIHRKPSQGPETWSVTVSGCPSLVGMNEEGIAVGTTNVKTWGARVGVGYMNILHRALSQTTWAAAAEVVVSAPRSGAHTYWVSDAEQASEWETSPDRAIHRDITTGPVTRTNHCLDETHCDLQWEPASPSSLARLKRLDEQLALGQHDLASLRALFADRSDGIHSLNRYPEDEQGTATNSVLIAIPAKRELWACRGPADRGLWQQLHFDSAR